MCLLICFGGANGAAAAKGLDAGIRHTNAWLRLQSGQHRTLAFFAPGGGGRAPSAAARLLLLRRCRSPSLGSLASAHTGSMQGSTRGLLRARWARTQVSAINRERAGAPRRVSHALSDRHHLGSLNPTARPRHPPSATYLAAGAGPGPRPPPSRCPGFFVGCFKPRVALCHLLHSSSLN